MTPKFNFRLAFIAFAALALSACASITAPVKTAETVEQKAYALYGTFVVFEEQGAALILDARTPLAVSRAIQRADAAVKPVADSTISAALELQRIRTAVLAGNSNTERLTIAATNLENYVARLEPLIANLVAAVAGGRR